MEILVLSSHKITLRITIVLRLLLKLCPRTVLDERLIYNRVNETEIYFDNKIMIKQWN